MEKLFSLADGSNHNVCKYCDYNTESECPCCTNLGFEGFTLNKHDKQIRKETLNELWKRAIHMHDEYIEYEELDNIIDEMLIKHRFFKEKNDENYSG